VLSPEQMQKIWDLSDTVIYRESVEFIRKIVKKEGNDPLPTSQVRGLFNIAGSASYSQLETFILHQRDRDWAPRQRNVKVFYTELEKLFTNLRTQRLRREFHLVEDKATPQETRQQVDALMVYIAHEFIQHLIAENNLLAQEHEEQRRNHNQQRRSGNPNPQYRNNR
jgi:hypothetical protein